MSEGEFEHRIREGVTSEFPAYPEPPEKTIQQALAEQKKLLEEILWLVSRGDRLGR